MAASDIQVANRALQKLGSNTILTSFNDNSAAGRAMSLAYVPVRDAELRRRRWKFSITRANLAALSTPPANGVYAAQFQLPANCLRVLEVGDYWPGADTSDYRNRTVAEWTIESGVILTNIAAPLSLRYIQQVTNPGMFDPAFAEAFAARLAWETCESITQSSDKRKLAENEYKRAILEATQANALETVSEFKADDSWMMARIQ
jgi:hypothetical protein